MIAFLDGLHARARANPALARLAILSRILLAIAFIPTAMVKVLGERFTYLSANTPIGFFFEAMYQSGAYWRFLGVSQVIAGVLLLIPSLSTLGAVLFFPIILNIFVITVSLHFAGTPFITGLMLLANVFLLCWDYDRLKAIVFAPATRPTVPSLTFGTVERVAFGICAAAGLTALTVSRALLPRTLLIPALVVGVGGTIVLIGTWSQLFLRTLADQKRRA